MSFSRPVMTAGVDIKVVPVQQEGGSIKSMESNESPLSVEPEVRQISEDVLP